MKLNRENKYNGKRILKSAFVLGTTASILLSMTGCGQENNNSNSVIGNVTSSYVESSNTVDKDDNSDSIIDNVNSGYIESSSTDAVEQTKSYSAENIRVINVLDPITSKEKYYFVSYSFSINEDDCDYDYESLKNECEGIIHTADLQKYLNSNTSYEFYHDTYNSIFNDGIFLINSHYSIVCDDDNKSSGYFFTQDLYTDNVYYTDATKIIDTKEKNYVRMYSFCDNSQNHKTYYSTKGEEYLYYIHYSPLTSYGYTGEFTIEELKSIYDQFNNTNEKKVVLTKTN